MAIDKAGYEPPTPDNNTIDDTPTSVEEVEKKFSNPTEITNTEEVIQFFLENFDKNRICVAIPITNEDEEMRRQELRQIGKSLRRAILEYTGLKRDSKIGASVECLIGEVTSDVAKHTVLRERFDKILILVTKNYLDISFHLVNPARQDANLHRIDQSASSDDYVKRVHGQSLARGLEEDLLKNGCSEVSDQSCLVQSDSKTVGVSRDISIKLPSNY